MVPARPFGASLKPIIRGVKIDTQTAVGSLGVLRHTRMPAILIELAFIDSPPSNPDVDILRNRRQDMAQAIASGLFQFLGVNQSPQDPTAPQIRPGHEPAVWAHDAWLWAMQNLEMDGTRPRDNITRQEVMTLLHRFYNLVNQQ